MSVVLSIFIMLLILTVLVVVHEWGHYISARIFGVKINEFSLFMGPKIFSRVGKKTGTVFSIRCLPIGGFCAMEGEESIEESDTAFCNKPWWQRTIILLSGVFMNFVLAIVVITIVFMIYGYDTRKINYTNEFLPAQIMNLQQGDMIIEFNDHGVLNSLDYNLINYVKASEDSTLTVKKANGTKEYFKLDRTINKDEKKAEIIIKNPKKNDVVIGRYSAKWDTDFLEINMVAEGESNSKYVFKKTLEGQYHGTFTKYNASGDTLLEESTYSESRTQSILASYNPYKVGFSFAHEDGNFFAAVKNAFFYNVSLVKSVFNSIIWLISGDLGMESMSGPIGLTTVIDDVVTAEVSVGVRFVSLMEMAALISANLAAFNILPIPGLDGGKLVFILIELIRRGKKIPPEKEAIVSVIFLALLILFSIFVAGNDIIRIFRS